MNAPVIAQKSPYAVNVEAGKTFAWCACGRSQGQPFCDGAHKGTGISPIRFKAAETGTVYFCGCKHSKTGAICDGTHKTLSGLVEPPPNPEEQMERFAKELKENDWGHQPC
jgi:CDGSH-type Zn-finger protein